MKKFVIVLAFLGMTAAAVVVVLKLLDRQVGDKDRPPTSVNTAAAVAPILVGRLLDDFRHDPAAAAKRFGRDALVVEGRALTATVLTEGKDNGAIVLPLASNTEAAFTVDCFLSAEAGKQAFRLTRGQLVKVRGKLVEGSSSAYQPELRDAEFVDLGPDPTIRVSAVQLTKEFSDNNAAAGTRYLRGMLLVDGRVVQCLGRTLLLEGFNEKARPPIRVEVYLLPGDYSRIKKSDMVLVRGECTGLVSGRVRLDIGRLVEEP